MKNNIPNIRKETSTYLTISAAIALLLLASPILLFSNSLLLQPAQAQSNTLSVSVRTPVPANGTATQSGDNASITFSAQGGTYINQHQLGASGTYQINSSSGQILYSGSVARIQGCCVTNLSSGDQFSLHLAPLGDQNYIYTSCSTSASNNIRVANIPGGDIGNFYGPVECSSTSQGGGNTTTAQPSSSSATGTTTTTQDGGSDSDGDGDGIPDSSDKCTHNSNPRCFKEGGDTSSSTTTTQQEQPSSNRTGNQTR